MCWLLKDLDFPQMFLVYLKGRESTKDFLEECIVVQLSRQKSKLFIMN